MIWGYVALGVLLVAILGGVVYWIKGAVSDKETLRQKTAALGVEREHLASMEAAASVARKERAEEFDAQADSVRTSDDASRLLRQAFPGSPSAH